MIKLYLINGLGKAKGYKNLSKGYQQKDLQKDSNQEPIRGPEISRT